MNDDPERGGFAAPARVHPLGESQQRPGGIVDPAGAQLHFESGPATGARVDHGVHLEAGVVAILIDPGVHGLGVHAKIPDDHGLEQEAEP